MDSAIKQYLIKLASTPAQFQGQLYNPAYSNLSPEQNMRAVSRDVQNYGYLTPGTPEYQQVLKERGFTPEYLQGVTSMGGRVLGAASDPKFVQQMQEGNSDFSQLFRDIDPVQVFGGRGNIARAAWNNPSETFSIAKDLWQGKSPAVLQSMGRHLAGSLDYNSPLMQQAKQRGATTYLQNQIGRVGQNWGRFGADLRGVLAFLLGMATKIPGYGYLANKMVDWTGGPQRFANIQNDIPAAFTLSTPAAPPAVTIPAAAANAVTSKVPGLINTVVNTGLPLMGLGKRSSAGPYSHYKFTVTKDGIEVLTPWNHR
jgi:hypothetical protein